MLSAQGKEILKQVADHIIAEPKRLNMATWISKKTYPSRIQHDSYARKVDNYDFPKCGTTGCIAGWVCLLQDGMDASIDKYIDIRHRASGLLGLDFWEARQLFYVDSWDEPYSTQYLEAETVEAKAKVAYDYIQHAIETM